MPFCGPGGGCRLCALPLGVQLASLVLRTGGAAVGQGCGFLCVWPVPPPPLRDASHRAVASGLQTSPEMTAKPKLLLSYPLTNATAPPPPDCAQKHATGQASVTSTAITYLLISLFNTEWALVCSEQPVHIVWLKHESLVAVSIAAILVSHL